MNSTIAFIFPVFREVLSWCQSIIGFTMVQDLASSVVESLVLSLIYLFLERLQLCRLLVFSRTVHGLTHLLLNIYSLVVVSVFIIEWCHLRRSCQLFNLEILRTLIFPLIHFFKVKHSFLNYQEVFKNYFFYFPLLLFSRLT